MKPDEPTATAQLRESPDVISADGSQPNEQEVKHGAAEMAKPIEATAQTNDAAEALNTLSLEPSNEPIRATKLFIGGLSYDTTDDSLGEYSAQFGEVVEAVVKFHRQTGEHRGFGFVTLRSADAVRAILSQSHTIDGTLVAPPVLARARRAARRRRRHQRRPRPGHHRRRRRHRAAQDLRRRPLALDHRGSLPGARETSPARHHARTTTTSIPHPPARATASASRRLSIF